MDGSLRIPESPPVPGLSAAETSAQFFEGFDALPPDDRLGVVVDLVLRRLKAIDESLARMAEMVAAIEDGR